MAIACTSLGTFHAHTVITDIYFATENFQSPFRTASFRTFERLTPFLDFLIIFACWSRNFSNKSSSIIIVIRVAISKNLEALCYLRNNPN